MVSSNAVRMLHCLESGTGLLRAGQSLTVVRQKCPALDVVRAEALGAIRDGIRFAHLITVQDVDVAAARVIRHARVGTVAAVAIVATAAIVGRARVGTVATVAIVATAAIVGRCRAERRAGCKAQSGPRPIGIPD